LLDPCGEHLPYLRVHRPARLRILDQLGAEQERPQVDRVHGVVPPHHPGVPLRARDPLLAGLPSPGSVGIRSSREIRSRRHAPMLGPVIIRGVWNAGIRGNYMRLLADSGGMTWN